ncbi:helix-turn-helix transcriptional regulator [Yeosuana sp. MJ-SS3]|uniref:Helix-turn-helix transcriptional regulator n=1 Tax=Gilvirhabdus luticola TaxID=3079858 RepID=A0ABU3U498_9FLAO|nr:helix-turn-helix transcriptional regulator [Yeosuana sp. MJ-SS3]MDU8885218.1 helix-turn-helix transcriptional regulator [Yeosuana sp. MJ-SS3]
MNLVATINFLLIAGVIQGFLFNLVTLFFRKKLTKAIWFLNLTVLFLSLNNLQAWIRENGYSSDILFIKQLEVPWYVLMFPFFYLFLVHFLKVENKVKDYLKLTLAVFFLEVIFRIFLIGFVYYYIPNNDTTIISRYTAFEEIINLIYCLFIFGQALILVFRKQKLYNYILTYDYINWIKLFLKLCCIVLFCWVLAVVFFNITGNRDAYLLLRFTDSLILYWIGYQGFYRYNVVNDRIMLRKSITTNKALQVADSQIKSRQDKVDFINEKHQKEFEELNSFIISNQLYTDPYLSMESLAEKQKISVSHLSKLINSFSNYNFSDYINSLRIEQAKKLLDDDSFDQYTIVAIGLESGFNSKSTFYTAFKKFTSQTPSQYRDVIQ